MQWCMGSVRMSVAISCCNKIERPNVTVWLVFQNPITYTCAYMYICAYVCAYTLTLCMYIMNAYTNVTRPAKINLVNTKNWQNFFKFALSK